MSGEYGTEELDRVIRDAHSRIDIYTFINPVNEDQEKERFLRGEVDEPAFEYRTPDYDPGKIEDELTGAEEHVPEGGLGRIYEKTLDELRQLNRIVANLGDEETVKEASRAVYGEPGEELVETAKTILQNVPPRDREKVVGTDAIKEQVEQVIDDLDMEGWNVEYKDKSIVSVKASDKTIYVPDPAKGITYPEGEAARTAVHEVLSHVLRAEDGYSQDYDVFGIGVGGYHATDEGLAITMEYLTGNGDDQLLREYALRTLAVDGANRDEPFRSTFERLREHGADEDQAWDLTKRAYRGGGFIKDHIYLEGLIEVSSSLHSEEDLEKLYVGKVGLQDMDLVDELLEEGAIEPPETLPTPIISEERIEKAEDIVRQHVERRPGKE